MARISEGERNGAAIAQPQAPIPAVSSRLPASPARRRHEQQAVAGQHHHHRSERAGQRGQADAKRRTGVVDRAAAFRCERARNRITSGRNARAAMCGVSSHTATTYSRRASSTLPNRKSPSGTRICVTEVSEYASAGQETVSRRARQPPRHQEQRAGSQNVEQARDAVKSDRRASRRAARRWPPPAPAPAADRWIQRECRYPKKATRWRETNCCRRAWPAPSRIRASTPCTSWTRRTCRGTRKR